MKSEKPLVIKALGWVLYIGGTLIKTALEISTPRSTDSLSLITERYERDEMGRAEYLKRRAKIMGN